MSLPKPNPNPNPNPETLISRGTAPAWMGDRAVRVDYPYDTDRNRPHAEAYAHLDFPQFCATPVDKQWAARCLNPSCSAWRIAWVGRTTRGSHDARQQVEEWQAGWVTVSGRPRVRVTNLGEWTAATPEQCMAFLTLNGYTTCPHCGEPSFDWIANTLTEVNAHAPLEAPESPDTTDDQSQSL